jgi:hypothetical protein
MEGVEILATIENSGVGNLGIILLASLIIGCIILIIVGIIEGIGVGAATGIATFMLLFLTSSTVAIATGACDEYTAYKVTISDEVNLKEFLDKYEIISREDEIFLIREIGERNE